MEVLATSSRVTKFGCDTVWCFLEEEDATEMQGQSRGTGPIMYLLLERLGKEKNGDGIAWISGRQRWVRTEGKRQEEADVEGEDRAMQVRASGT